MGLPNDRQPLAERNRVYRQDVGLNDSPDTHLIGGATRRRQQFWEHQELDRRRAVDQFRRCSPPQVSGRRTLEVESLTLRRSFVGRAQDFDGRHDAMAGFDVDDLDVAFGCGLDVEMDQDRLGRNEVVIRRVGLGLDQRGCLRPVFLRASGTLTTRTSG